MFFQDYNWSKTCRTAQGWRPLWGLFPKLFGTFYPVDLLQDVFIVEKFRLSDQILLFLVICCVFAFTLSIILGVSLILYGRCNHYNTLFIDEKRTNILNIHAPPPRRWSGPTYKRKTNAAVRRVKSGVKRGFICGINGIYRDGTGMSTHIHNIC